MSSEDGGNSSLNVTYEEISFTNKKQNEGTGESKILFNEEAEENTINNNENFNFNRTNIFNDDMSDSGYMNRNFETNLEEIFENLNYFLNGERKKSKIEKDTLNKTIQKFIEFNADETNKIEKEKEKWKNNSKLAYDLNIKPDEIIDLSVGGKFMSTSKQTLMKYPNSFLYKTIMKKFDESGKRIFIERDSDTFIRMLNYIRNKKVPFFNSKEDEQKFYYELSYWQIPIIETHKNKISFTFDTEWCAKTLVIEKPQKLSKSNVQHGIVFCKPPMDNINDYIEFKIYMKTPCRGKSHIFLGLVDKTKYKHENLISTFWKDSPSSFYWDVWNTKLIKTDDTGVQIGNLSGYGCQCETQITILSMKYNSSEKTLTYYKNGIDLGVAFREVPSGLTPSLDLWFEEGTVEINNVQKIEEKSFL